MNKLRIPKKIKVGGFYYDIIFPYKFEDNVNYLGLHEWDSLTIKLGLFHHGVVINEQVLYSTFLHEIIHAIDQVYCAKAIDSENITDRLASGLYQVLSENNLYLNSNKIPKRIKIGGLYAKVRYPYVFKDENAGATIEITTLDLKIGEKSRAELAHLDIIGSLVIMLCDMYCIRFGEVDKGEENILDSNIANHFVQGLYQVLVDNNIEYVIRGK